MAENTSTAMITQLIQYSQLLGDEQDIPFAASVQQPTTRREPHQTPLLLEVSQTIRRLGGVIWSIDKVPEVGVQFRFEIATRQLRVLMPMPGQPSPVDLPERGSPCHVVQTLAALEEWLRSQSNTKKADAAPSIGSKL